MGKLTTSSQGNIDSRTAVHAVRDCLFHITLGLTLTSFVSGQSASNFDAKTVVPKTATVKKEKVAAPVAKEAGPVSATPSRYVSEAELDSYVESLAAIFSMRGRATDPFGQYQDPDAKPIIKTSVAKKPGRPTQMQLAPLSEIVQKIRVTTIIPRDKKFLVGNREFKLGGILPVTFRTKTIKLEVVNVSSHVIDFRNMENGETATLKIEILPLGMSPGTRGIIAPGMTPDNQNAPLELDEISSPDAESENR
jgi:hypothetical protein